MAQTFHITVEQGATFWLRATWQAAGVPVNLTGYTARMQVRRTPNSPLLMEFSTAAGTIQLNSSGVINVAGLVNLDEITYRDAVYDLEVTSPNGTVTRVLEGAVFLSPTVYASYTPPVTTPDWLPFGATFFADFVNGYYYDHGPVADPSTIFATDEIDGDYWDASKIVPGVGYGNDNLSNSAGARLIGPSALSAAPELTIVLEFDTYDEIALPQGSVFVWDGTEDYGTYSGAQARASFNAYLYDTSSSTTSANTALSGRNRLAFSISASTGKLAASLNGGDVWTIATPDFGSNVWGAINFSVFQGPARTLTIYPVKTDAELVTLSTLP